MAQNNIVIKIDDGGDLAKLIAQSAQFRDNIDAAGKALPKAASNARNVGQEGREYGIGRSAVGTGAASRDFAKQAQGLGGLVHLYATFAANIFAVSAAFNALQKAADTTNLVKGLDQLGAASGRGLGQLAQDVVKATDGAVSLRDAMTSVAQASSAGMSDKDIKRLATGAKQASQALGVDMSDALSRLSRGITKLEPELLDELGIFVRVDKASQDYAKSIGKPVSALTDLEKRSAFAAAALKQVEQKFGEIDIPSNPYTQLAAEFQNISTSGLNMINTVLGPLVKYLGSSPMALATVLGVITTKLIGQAIPAIGQYREGLKAAADQAKAIADMRASKAADVRKQGLDSFADARVADAMKAEKAFDAAFARSKGRYIKEARALMADKNLPIYEKDSESGKQLIATLDKAYASAKRGKEEILAMKNAAIAAQQAHDDYINKPLEKGSAAWVADREAKKSSSASARSIAIANASDNAAIGGVRFAFKELKKEVDLNKTSMSSFDRVLSLVGGTASALTTRIVGLGSVLLSAFGWISAIIGAGAMLFSFFSKNEKEASVFADSIHEANNSADSLNNTIDRLYKSKNIDNFLSPESVIARANALSTLKSSMDSVIDSYDKVTNASSFTDKTKNFLLELVDMSNEDDLVKAISSQLQSAYKAALSDPKLKDLANKLAPLANKGRNLEREDIDQARAILGNVSAYQQYANAISDAETSTKALSKATLDLQNTYKINSPINSQIAAIMQLSTSTLRLVDAGDLSVTTLSTIKKGLEELKTTGISSAASIDALISNIDRIDAGKLADAQKGLKVAQDILKRDPNDKDAQFDVRYYTNLINNINSKIRDSKADIVKAFGSAFISSVAVLGAELDKEFAKARTISATAQLGYYASDSSERIRQEAKIKLAEIAAIERAASAADQFSEAMYKASLQADRLAVAGKRTNAGVTTAVMDEIEAAVSGKGNPLKALGDLAKKYSGDADILEMIKKYTPQAERAGMNAARRAQSNAQAGAIKTGADIAINNNDSKLQADKRLQAEMQIVNVQKEQLSIQEKLGSLTDAESIKRRGELEYEEMYLNFERQKADLIQEILNAEKSGNEKEVKRAKDKYRRFEDNADMQLSSKESSNNASVLAARRKATQESEISAMNVIGINQEAYYEKSLATLDLEQQQLEQKKAQGKISEDSYNATLASVEAAKAELTYQKQLAAAKLNYNKATKADRDLIARAETDASISLTALTAAEERLAENTAEFQKQASALEDVKNKSLDAAKNIDSMSSAMKTFDKWAEDSMSSFTDALFEATQTGKFEFTQMVESMLLDLARLEFKQSMMKMYQDAGGASGIGNMLMEGAKLFMGSSSGGMGMTTMANGGAWYNGIQAFANGGTFTNSIVNSPTLFKFAKGTGLMGEAGPEAIMPLTRDTSGKLGVAAHGTGGSSEVSVVINNFSDKDASTKEVVDSRGKKSIEVTIGDAVASQISKIGTQANSSIRNTFGASPVLIKR